MARCDGGYVPSDGGALLLREVERQTGILHRLAACFTDQRTADQRGLVQWVSLDHNLSARLYPAALLLAAAPGGRRSLTVASACGAPDSRSVAADGQKEAETVQ